MNWWEWIIVLWGVTGVFVAIALILDTNGWYDARWFAMVPGLVVGLFAVIMSITLPLYVVNRSVTAENCRNWGIQNDRPAKFASYTFWTYGCVTPDGHGHWIPTGQIFVNVPKVER